MNKYQDPKNRAAVRDKKQTNSLSQSTHKHKSRTSKRFHFHLSSACVAISLCLGSLGHVAHTKENIKNPCSGAKTHQCSCSNSCGDDKQNVAAEGSEAPSSAHPSNNTIHISENDSSGKTVVGGSSLNESASHNLIDIVGDRKFDFVVGGESYQANANENQVEISGHSHAIEIAGGLTHDGTANGNIVTLKNQASVEIVRGGKAEKSGDASDNHLVMEDSSSSMLVAGGTSVSGDARNNTVSLSHTAALTIYGGMTENGVLEDNVVSLEDNTVVTTVYGGLITKATNTEGAVKRNRVVVEDSTVTYEVVGGYAVEGNVGGSTDDGNSVELIHAVTNIAFGGYSAKGSVSGNRVSAINESKVEDVYGGYAYTEGDAKNNSVRLNKTKSTGVIAAGRNSYGATFLNTVGISESDISEVYGGYVRFKGDTSENTVSLSNSSVHKFVLGGRTSEGNAEQNLAALSGSTAPTAVGALSIKGNAVGNQVELTEHSQVKNAVGGVIKDVGTVSKNIVLADHSTLSEGAIGGLAIHTNDQNASQWVTKNQVQLSHSKAEYAVGGAALHEEKSKSSFINSAAKESNQSEAAAPIAASQQKVNHNAVKLKNSEVRTILGGFSSHHEVSSNLVELNDSKALGNVYGGYSDYGNFLQNNTVALRGDTEVFGNVYGAYAGHARGDFLTGNSVVLDGNIRVHGTIFGAGTAGGGINEGGNSLVFSGLIEAGKIEGFSELHFLLSRENELLDNTEYLLTLTDSHQADLTGKEIHLYDFDNRVQKDQEAKYGLIRIQNNLSNRGTNEEGIHLDGKVTLHGTFNDTQWQIVNQDAGELYLTGKNIVVVPPEYFEPVPPVNPPEPPQPEVPSAPSTPSVPDETEPVKPVPEPSTPDAPKPDVTPSTPESPTPEEAPTTPEEPKPDETPSTPALPNEPSSGETPPSGPNPDESSEEEQKPEQEPQPSKPTAGIEQGTVITGTTQSNQNAVSISENRLASLMLVNQSGLFIAEELPAIMRDEIGGTYTFAVTEGGTNRYGKSGNHFDLNGVILVAGAGAKFGQAKISGFFEGSLAHAAGKKHGYSAQSNLSSYGIGLAAVYDFNDRFEVDASLRAGQVRNRFKGNYYDVGTRADFVTRSPYLSAHLGARVTYPVSPTVNLSAYGKYLYTFLAKDNTSTGLSSASQYRAKSSSIHSLTFGLSAEWQPIDRVKFSGSLGVLETMGGRSKGAIDEVALKAVSANGTSGVAALSVLIKPTRSSPWEMNLGIKGYVGARQGVVGDARLTYRF